MKSKSLLCTALFVACLCSGSLKATANKNEVYRIIENNVKESNNEIWISNQQYSIGDTIFIWNGFLTCPFEKAWGVFVDEQPLQNWGHECQYIFINSSNGEYKQYNRYSPPYKISENWTKYRSVYPTTSKDTTKIKSLLSCQKQKSHTKTADLENSNLYAIIIDYCGPDPEYNFERLWNDCSAMYTTLLNNGYPKDHIYVAMPDSSFLLHLGTGQFIVFPTDLDGDGVRDVNYKPTVEGIDKIFQDISDVLTEDDILLVYLTGHGNAIFDFSTTFFGMVMGENIMYFDRELFLNLAELNAGFLNLIVQRNYEFYFTHSDTVLYNNASFQTVISCDDNGHVNPNSHIIDEYTYNFTNAVNRVNTADLNADGYISMYEAHNYAVSSTTCADPSYRPSQNSQPVCLRHALTVSGTISNDPCVSSDLFIKDNSSDFGIEPNTSTDLFYISPDIWVEDLSGNVVNTLMSNELYNVCVKIHNMGSDDSEGNEELHLHWVKAVIGGQWPDSWIDGSVYDCSGTLVNPGGEITPNEGWALPSIPAGGEYIVRVPWITPNNADYTVCSEFTNNVEQLWHYCLLARLYEGDNTPGADLTYQPLNEFVLNSNNVASRNITIMNEIDNNNIAATVGVIAPYDGVFSLQYKLYINYDNFFSNNFNINIYIDDDLRSNWSGDSFGLMDLGDRFQLTNPLAELQQMDLYDNTLYSVYVEVEDGALFDFLFDIALTDTNGIVVGGERFQYTPGITTSNRVSSIKNTDKDTQYDFTQLSFDEDQRVLVINTYGQVVAQSYGFYTTDITKLPKGVYIIIIENTNETKIYKITR